MRNIKILWGVIVILLVSVLILSVVVAGQDADRQVDPAKPPEDYEQEDPVVARIGSFEMTYSELQQQLNSKYGTELIQLVLDRQAIVQEARELAIHVTEEDIERELRRMMQGYEDEQHFYRLMQEQLGLSREELVEDIYYKLLLEEVAIDGIRISDELVQEYIKLYGDYLFRPAQLRIQWIVVEKREQAFQIVEELKLGASFESIAKDRSLDPVTAASGGDLGWIDEEDPFIQSSVLEAAKRLGPGQFEGPVQVEGGFAVILLKERKESGETEAEIQERIRRDLALTQAPPLREVVAKIRTKRGAQIVDSRYR